MNETIFESVSELIGQLRYTKGRIEEINQSDDPVEKRRIMTDVELSVEDMIKGARSIEDQVSAAMQEDS